VVGPSTATYPGRVIRPSCRTAAVITTAAMSVLTAVSLWALHVAGLATAVDLAVAVVACGLVPLLVRWPVLAGLALGVLAAVSPVATPGATLAALLTARLRRFSAAVAVAVTGLAAHAVQGWWRPTGGMPYGWWLLLLACAYAALVGWGALARARYALLMSLRERARRAEAEQGRRVAEARVAERTRIAREMHDVLAHRLSLLATFAGALEYRPDSPPEQLSKAAGVIRVGVHQALEELRQVVTLLRGGDGDDAGPPQPVLADLPTLIEESRDAGTPVRLESRIADLSTVPPTTGRTAYRVVQEALTNARKHAPGLPVTVTLDGRPGGELVVEVGNPLPDPLPDPLSDPLSGKASAAPGGGAGLVGLTERVDLAGGRIDHEIMADGFRVCARLPWPA
jgi:signal transduction histidine kinase